ncbi:hypothetical protein [Bradyrhizobium sp. AZCC 1693]|uniref:hypothetical protein n=1 Tax=Bradyrhizobium sp. AZCC 1693 TaxID=3117029 RepID=UPI002FF0B952
MSGLITLGRRKADGSTRALAIVIVRSRADFSGWRTEFGRRWWAANVNHERQANPTCFRSNDALRRISAVWSSSNGSNADADVLTLSRTATVTVTVTGAQYESVTHFNSTDNRSGATRTINPLSFHPVVIPEFQTAIATSTSLSSPTTR